MSKYQPIDDRAELTRRNAQIEKARHERWLNTPAIEREKPTQTGIATAYAPPLEPWGRAELDELVALMKKKDTKGEVEYRALNIPLREVLLSKYDYDAHFAMYAEEKDRRCIKANTENYKLRFTVAVFDLDFKGHKELPSKRDFADLVRFIHLFIPKKPNVIYRTRGGARILYYIKPITDPEEFEGRLGSLLQRLKKLIDKGTDYELDKNCKDWTRLFRCPRVIRDGESFHDVIVHEFHKRVMDMTRFAYTKKPKPKKGPGNAKFTKLTPHLAACLNEIAEGNRNAGLNKAIFLAFKTYAPGEAEKAAMIFVDKAQAEGLSEQEAWNTYRSARRAAIGE